MDIFESVPEAYKIISDKPTTTSNITKRLYLASVVEILERKRYYPYE
jgi:hypothetical protein